MNGLMGLLGLLVLFLFTVLIYFYPHLPQSMSGWVALFVFGFPAWIMLELLGEFVFQSNFVKKMSSGKRIAFAVLVISLLTPIAVFVFSVINNGVNSDGG